MVLVRLVPALELQVAARLERDALPGSAVPLPRLAPCGDKHTSGLLYTQVLYTQDAWVVCCAFGSGNKRLVWSFGTASMCRSIQ